MLSLFSLEERNVYLPLVGQQVESADLVSDHQWQEMSKWNEAASVEVQPGH